MTAIDARVARWRRRIRLTAMARALLVGVGAGLVAWTVAGLTISPGHVALGVIAGSAAALVVWWRSAAHALSPQRAALWLEEHEPRLRWALVTVMEADASPGSRVALESSIGAIPWEEPARRALGRSLRLPALVALAGAALALLAPARDAGGVGASRRAPGGGGREEATASALGAVTVEVQPPRYARRAAERLTSPVLIRAYPGSRVAIDGSGAPDRTVVALDSLRLSVAARGSGWGATFTTRGARALVRVQRAGGESRLIAMEPLVDSAPVITLRAPARDTVLRVARGAIPLIADVRDDLGLAGANFEYIISSGEGERFTFRSGTLGELSGKGETRGTLSATLSLEGLGLAPGDVVHLRAVARDLNDVTGPGAGTSESRTVRIARADEYDSVAVDQAPPPEVDKSLLSQRMLINLTEALVKRARTMPRADVVGESRRIGRDQTRLRKQVSDIIFARLGDGAEGGGEHFHGDGHGHAEGESLGTGPLTPEQLLKAAEQATVISGSPTDFEHDETPVVAINRPMLEAYNAMWDAGRALDGGEPARALPPMYAALAAIQRARAAERLYLRGAPPRVVVDLAKVRLAGKDRGTPAGRTPRARLDEMRAPLLARFGGALDALARDAVAGVDSLIVLRLAVADRLPAAAGALEAAIGALRASRDATPALLRARRALDDALAARDTLAPWGTPP